MDQDSDALRSALEADGIRLLRGRFVRIEVMRDQTIRDSVDSTPNIDFSMGVSYYEFVKPEDVAETKQVVMWDADSDRYYTGAFVRKMIGLPVGSSVKCFKPMCDLPDGLIPFIESKSENRIVKTGTTVIFDNEMYDVKAAEREERESMRQQRKVKREQSKKKRMKHV